MYINIIIYNYKEKEYLVIVYYNILNSSLFQRTVNADLVKELIKMMKTCCGKTIAKKLYCSIATWFWIALQDPKKKLVCILTIKLSCVLYISNFSQ